MNIKKYYDDASEDYDQMADKLQWNVKKWIPSINELSGNFILDVACGSGYVCDLINPVINNIVVHGCDFSDNMLNFAANKGHYQVLYNQDLNDKWQNSAVNIVNNKDFEVPENFYDYAFCFGAFEYLKINKLLSAIERILLQIKSNGRFIFNTHRIPHPQISDIIPHDMGEVLINIQKFCNVNRVDPVVAYKIDPDTSVEYLIWDVTKK